MNRYVIQKRKIKYYLLNCFTLFIPRYFYRIRIEYELRRINHYNLECLLSRVDYYNKIEKPFQLKKDALDLKDLFDSQIEKFKSKIFEKRKLKKGLLIFLTYIITYPISLLFSK